MTSIWTGDTPSRARNLDTLQPLSMSGVQFFSEPDAAGSTVMSGGAVAAINDLSGHSGRALVQATAANRPRIWRDQGAPTWLFDGISQYIGGTFTLAQPSTIFLVYRHMSVSSTVNSNDAICDGGSNLTFLFGEDTTRAFIYSGASGPLLAPTISNNTYAYVVLTSNGLTSTIRSNGVQLAAGQGGVGTPGGLTLGATANGSRPSNIAIKSILVSSGPTAADIAAWELRCQKKFGLGQSTADVTVVDPGSVVLSDLSSAYYGLIQGSPGANGAVADIASTSDGADGMNRTYLLNRAQNAGPVGMRSAWFLPAGAGTYTLSFDYKRSAAVAVDQIFIVDINQLGAWVGGLPLTTATTAWQTLTRSVTLTADEAYLSFIINYTAWGGTTQGRVLIRNVRLTPAVATSNRYELSPDQYYDKGRNQAPTTSQRQLWGPSLPRIRLDVGSAPSIDVEVNALLAPSNPNQSPISVWQNGAVCGTVTPLGSGASSRATVTLPGTGPIDIVGGSSASLSGGSDSIVYTSTPRAVYVNNLYPVKKYLAPAQQIVLYADSIGVGYDTIPSSQYGWPMTLRNLVWPKPVALEGWGSRALYNDWVKDSTFVAFATTALQYGRGNVIIKQVSANDYLHDVWSAASYGAALAVWADAIHTADPTATIVFQTAFKQSVETERTAGWGNLEAYRAQDRIVQAARSSWTVICEGPVDIITTVPAFDGIHFSNVDSPTVAANYATFLRSKGLA